MLLLIVIIVCCFLIVFLFAFAWMLDRRTGILALVVIGAWLFSTQPADAQPVGDENWPGINDGQMQPLMMAHNAFGDRIVLFAQFCGGSDDGARRDHMHVYAIYNGHNAFVQGGCWQYKPDEIKASKTIKYFDLNGAGWDAWPLSAFKLVKGK